MRFVPVKIIRKTFRTQHEWNMMRWNVSDSGVRRKLCRKTSGGMGLKWTLGSMVFLRANRKQLKRHSFFSWAGKRKNGERTENYYDGNRFCLLSSPLTNLLGNDEKQCAPCMRSTKAAFRVKKLSKAFKFSIHGKLPLELLVKDESCTWMDVNACTVDLWHDKRGFL